MTCVTQHGIGLALTTLRPLQPWEATLVLNFRLWCDGPMAQQEVWSEYRRTFAGPEARTKLRQFETLVTTLIYRARRPLVRHQVGCTCVGSDECALVDLVRIASDGDLNEAALIAALIVEAGWAEDIAWMAQQVGRGCRQLSAVPVSVMVPPVGAMLH